MHELYEMMWVIGLENDSLSESSAEPANEDIQQMLGLGESARPLELTRAVGESARPLELTRAK